MPLANKNAFFGQAKVDALLLKNDDLNFNYFSRLPTVFGRSFLILKPQSQTLYASILDYGAVKKLKPKQTRLKLLKDKQQAVKLIQKELKGCRRIGFNAEAVSKKHYPHFRKMLPGKKLIDCSEQLHGLRAVKGKEEIKKLKQACKISLEALTQVENKIRPGMRESDLALELNHLIAKSGASLTFETIVASGRNAGVPHHITSKKKLKKGELLLIDFGARWQLYGSDISRTYSLGRATEKQKQLYAVVYNALQSGLKEILPGYKAQEAFQVADTVLKKAGHKMIHALGHGIGLRDHDFPGGIGRESKWLFKENMCLAVEPGIYAKQFGIRLEDNIVVKKQKPLMLSRAPKELISL